MRERVRSLGRGGDERERGREAIIGRLVVDVVVDRPLSLSLVLDSFLFCGLPRSLCRFQRSGRATTSGSAEPRRAAGAGAARRKQTLLLIAGGGGRRPKTAARLSSVWPPLRRLALFCFPLFLASRCEVDSQSVPHLQMAPPSLKSERAKEPRRRKKKDDDDRSRRLLREEIGADSEVSLCTVSGSIVAIAFHGIQKTLRQCWIGFSRSEKDTCDCQRRLLRNRIVARKTLVRSPSTSSLSHSPPSLPLKTPPTPNHFQPKTTPRPRPPRPPKPSRRTPTSVAARSAPPSSSTAPRRSSAPASPSSPARSLLVPPASMSSTS